MPSSGILWHVALVRTDVSEESIAPIIKMTRIGELGTSTVTTNRRRLRRNATFLWNLGSYKSDMASRPRIWNSLRYLQHGSVILSTIYVVHISKKSILWIHLNIGSLFHNFSTEIRSVLLVSQFEISRPIKFVRCPLALVRPLFYLSLWWGSVTITFITFQPISTP
jgi:hypothetical protein